MMPADNDTTPTLPVDEPPADGVWRDWEGAQLDPVVVRAGNLLGESIDVDDDMDNGAVTAP